MEKYFILIIWLEVSKGTLDPNPGNTCSIYFSKSALSSGATTSYSSAWNTVSCKNNPFILDTVNNCWCALGDGNNEYFEINAGSIVTWVSITTQGCAIYQEWVTSYKIKYSSNGSTWNWWNGGTILTANSDANTHVTHYFIPTFTAITIRIYPVSRHSWRSMRLDAYYMS